MKTSAVTPEIAYFAEGVRAALADLPADEVEDLTEGLEADLAESLAEDLRRTLPDPVSYAAELRLAAGLPAQVERRGRAKSVAAEALLTVRRGVAELGDSLRGNPLTSGAIDFAVALRPAWWLVRAWVVFTAVRVGMGAPDAATPHDLPDLLALGVLLLVSVQWGRGRWLPRRLLATLLVLVNVAAVLLLLPAASEARDSLYDTRFVSATEDTQAAVPGLAMDGRALDNVYAYDRDGTLLRGVQLFDSAGLPLTTQATQRVATCVDDGCGFQWMWAPRTTTGGESVWNVFPLNRVNAQFDVETDRYEPGFNDKLERQPAPFPRVPALVRPEKVANPND